MFLTELTRTQNTVKSPFYNICRKEQFLRYKTLITWNVVYYQYLTVAFICQIAIMIKNTAYFSSTFFRIKQSNIANLWIVQYVHSLLLSSNIRWATKFSFIQTNLFIWIIHKKHLDKIKAAYLCSFFILNIALNMCNDDIMYSAEGERFFKSHVRSLPS